MHRLLLAFILLIVNELSHVTGQQSCYDGWIFSPSSGSCFKLYFYEINWFDARSECIKDAGDLIKMADIDMNNLVAGQVNAMSSTFWIGLNDIAEEGTFVWLDETDPITWNVWAPGQPEVLVSGDGGEDCALMGLLMNTQWTDDLCISTRGYICEKPATDAVSFVTCPNGWLESAASGTCVLYSGDEKTWSDARVACQGYGGDLVRITSTAMNDMITSYMPTYQGSLSGVYWIGLSDLTLGGTFMWLDDTLEGQYVNWGENEPATMMTGAIEQDCVDIGSTSTTQWADSECDILAQYICEIAPTMYLNTDLECGYTDVLSPTSWTCLSFTDDSRTTWDSARDKCQRGGGDLVRIKDDYMNDIIADRVTIGTPLWIGLHDSNANGKFVWLDDTYGATFTKWYIGQPDDLDSTGMSSGQTCALVGLVAQDWWNDDVCDNRIGYICEYPPGANNNTSSDSTATAGLSSGATAAVVIVVLLLAIAFCVGGYAGYKYYTTGTVGLPLSFSNNIFGGSGAAKMQEEA